VVSKQARVVEEVRVSKEATERAETVHDMVRRTDVDVEQLDAGKLKGSPRGRPTGSASLPDSEFRTHYQTQYANTGRPYDDYAPAYEYGSRLAGDARYHGRDWTAMESNVRRDWEASHPGSAWANFKDAVRHGWERVSGKR